MITISDSTGNLGDAATTKGYLDAIAAVEKVFDSGQGIFIKTFFENGKTTKPKIAALEATLAANQIDDKSIRSTVINIANLLNKAEDFAVAE